MREPPLLKTIRKKAVSHVLSIFALPMNYISHYFLDSRLEQPYYDLGLAWPDLMGNFHRAWKPLRRAGLPFENTEGRHLWEGVQAHLDADALFHNSDFFREQSHDIRIRMEQQGLGGRGPRLFFLAHISLEVLLDRLIIVNYPGVADRFYTDLFSVDEESVASELRNAVNPDYGHFFEMFHRFRQSRYLYAYAEADKMLYAMNRIMGRAKQNLLDENLHERLKTALLLSEEALSKVYLDFFEWMQARLARLRKP